MPFSLLRDRLHERLNKMGIKILHVHEEVSTILHPALHHIKGYVKSYLRILKKGCFSKVGPFTDTIIFFTYVVRCRSGHIFPLEAVYP